MRISDSSKIAQKFHCKTCGADYRSTTYESERSDGMVCTNLDEPHDCPLPCGVFFLRTETEYEYREGVLFSRQIQYRTYSGHDSVFAKELTVWGEHAKHGMEEPNESASDG